MKTANKPVLDKLLDLFTRILTLEVAKRLVALRFDSKAQNRIDKLAAKCNEGRLSEAERREYKTYVYAIDFIATLQPKAPTLLKKPSD